MQRVIPGMRDRKRGWLLNISSTTAASPPGPPYDDFAMHRGVATYASNKAALDRMSTGLAAELHEFGIAVNSLSPVAAVLTDAAAALGVIPDDSPTEPVEVMAEAALALCSGDPAKLTGRVATSGAILAELGRSARTLDGKSVL
jgi:NAD(P)-dependent dehydrogenase (short-subunit alcohol dehydrogenase family)